MGCDDATCRSTLREQLKRSIHAHDVAVGAQARLARHDTEISVAAWRRCVHRERFDSREPGFLRRGQRPPHALRLDTGRLRIRLQLLRERTGWMETQSGRRRKSSSRSSPSNGDAFGGEPSSVESPNSASLAIPTRRQPCHHGHGRAARQLRQPAQGAEDSERAVGRGDWRAEDHDFHQRPCAADPQARRGAAAVSPRHLPPRRDRRSASADHAREPQVSAARADRRLRVLSRRKRAA